MEPNAAVATVEKPRSWYQRLYARVEALSETPHALAALLLVSCVDGSVFPIPPFALLIPMVFTNPKRWWRLAFWGTLASLVGGFLGYAIGSGIHAGAVQFLHVDFNRRVDALGIHSTVGDLLGKNFWVLALLCSVLPTPFKVVAIGSGVFQVPLSRFFLAALFGRTARFFGIAALCAFAGPKAKRWFKR